MRIPAFITIAFKIWAGLCTIVVSAALLHCVFLVFANQDACVGFPNGSRLCYSQYFFKGVALYNEHKRRILGPRVYDVIWNDEYIAGDANIIDSKNGSESHVKFIYKRGDTAAKLYTDKNEYEHQIKAIGLSESIEIAPRHFQNQQKTYQDLINKPGFRRMWYE